MKTSKVLHKLSTIGFFRVLLAVLLSVLMCYLSYSDDYTWYVTQFAYNRSTDFISYLLTLKSLVIVLITLIILLLSYAVIYSGDD